MLRIRRLHPATFLRREKTMFVHQSGHAVSTCFTALFTQSTIDTRTAIVFGVTTANLTYLFEKLHVRGATRRGLLRHPRVVAAG